MMNASFHGTLSRPVGRLGDVSKLGALRLTVSLNLGICWACAAYHSRHLSSELLVQQSIHKRVDSRVEKDTDYVINGNRDFTNAVGCEVHHNAYN